MSSPQGAASSPQSGVRTVHTPRAIGAIPAKPTPRQIAAQAKAKPAAKPARRSAPAKRGGKR